MKTMKEWRPEEIKTFRQKLKMTQKAFGDMVGTSGNYIWMLERGDRRASRTLKILLSYLDKQENE
jgi:DNA-binding transcriptional regulator YiaG